VVLAVAAHPANPQIALVGVLDGEAVGSPAKGTGADVVLPGTTKPRHEGHKVGGGVNQFGVHVALQD